MSEILALLPSAAEFARQRADLLGKRNPMRSDSVVVAIIAALVLYVLAPGPVSLLVHRGSLPRSAESAFAPLHWCSHRSALIEEGYHWYLSFFVPWWFDAGFDKWHEI